MASDNPIVTEALERLKLAKEAVAKQRDREKEALRFQVPELQWEDEAKRSRMGTIVDGVPVPPRPMISIPKLNQPIQTVLNQEKAAHLGVKVSPLNEEATDDAAEVIQDLYRREEQRSRAGIARSWAFDRAVKAGTGWYQIDTEYDDESDNPFDQKVVWRRLLHQDAVYDDPAAQEPDACDREWLHHLSWLPWKTYVRKYGESRLAKEGIDSLKGLAEQAPDWVNLSDSDNPAVLVSAYWRKEYEQKTWVILEDGSFKYREDLAKDDVLLDEAEGGRERKIDVPKVIWSVINGDEEIDGPEEWNGKYIPYIKCVGNELQPFDSERRWQGIIEPAMGGQRLFNYAASTAVELAALEPKAPFDVDPEEIEGYTQFWQQASVRNFPYLPRNKFNSRGEPFGPLQRIQTDVSKLGPAMQLLEMADNFLQAATATVDPSALERLARKKVAHQTIDNMVDQGEAGNSQYLHNLATISMPYEAKVVIDLMAHIYDRPGRVARLLDMEDNERTVLLNQPFVSDQDGRPRPAQEGQKDAKHYDLTKGSYGVSVSIGKSWQTRLQQGADEIGQILTGSPELMPLIGATYFKFRDFPGSKEVADILKEVREKQFPGLGRKDGKPDAEQMAAELSAAQQQIQMLTQQLQQAAMAIEADKAKQEAQIAKTQMDNSTKVKVEDMDNQTKVYLERMKQEFEMALERMKMQHEQSLAQLAGQQQAELAEQGHSHSLIEANNQPEPRPKGPNA